ncbi:hypothetical protein BC941DRAFT_466908 [Chlamydoabsidia padenii]|nr:hypothetical protein BC941DRAFT_466908 [Chlamydoabsidia padenii]
MFTGTLWLVFMDYGWAFFLDCCVWFFMISLSFWYKACLPVLLPAFHVYRHLWSAWPSLFAVAGRRRHRVLFHTWICWRMGCAATSYGAPVDSWRWIMMCNVHGYFMACLHGLWLGFLP